MPHDVFISYSSWDRPLADAVCRQMEDNGLSCWIAHRDIKAGSDFSNAVVDAIDECRIVVLVLSSRSDSSPQVVREVGKATASGKLIVSLRVEDFKLSGGLEYSIRHLHHLDAVNRPLEEVLEALVQNLRQTLSLQVSDIRPCPTGANAGESSSIETRPPPAGREPRQTHCDIFISYRRDRDAQTARLIRTELERRRFRVFLDVDDLRPGHFDEALLRCIQDAPSFVVILSTGSLDRCVQPDDWLRQEIACALANKKTVLPIMMPGFRFPTEDELSEDIQAIRTHQGVNYSHDFFEAMMEKIVSYLNTPGSANNRRTY